jgi:YgiT-type zinc finger domain-containing protein
MNEQVPPKPCVMCRVGQLAPGQTTMTLRRGDVVMLIHQVPGDVCDTCDNAVVDSSTAQTVQEMFEQAIAAGARYAVREYAVKGA